jgi:DNA-binding CsgD family transcriptional regulator
MHDARLDTQFPSELYSGSDQAIVHCRQSLDVQTRQYCFSVSYRVSDLAESHFRVEYKNEANVFCRLKIDEIASLLLGFPKLHRWLLLERGLIQPSSRPLSPREKEVLQLVLGPKSETQIANELCLAKGTVHNHITKLYSVYNVSSRYQLLQLWF